MRRRRLWDLVNFAVPLAISLAVPLAIYLINGAVEPWTFLLGAVIGFGVWYAWPF